MTQIILDVRGKESSHTFPSDMTNRQVGCYLAERCEIFMWWYADWRLFRREGEPGAWTLGGPMLPNNYIGTHDGKVLVLGWVEEAETWN